MSELLVTIMASEQAYSKSWGVGLILQKRAHHMEISLYKGYRQLG